jgi:hypothetical protein
MREAGEAERLAREARSRPFFDTTDRNIGHRDCVKQVGGHQMEWLVESKIRPEPFETPASDDRADTRASLILISLSSLGLWAAIWGATSLAAAVLP